MPSTRPQPERLPVTLRPVMDRAERPSVARLLARADAGEHITMDVSLDELIPSSALDPARAPTQPMPACTGTEVWPRR